MLPEFLLRAGDPSFPHSGAASSPPPPPQSSPLSGRLTGPWPAKLCICSRSALQRGKDTQPPKTLTCERKPGHARSAGDTQQ